jgi:hypothetical protein
MPATSNGGIRLSNQRVLMPPVTVRQGDRSSPDPSTPPRQQSQFPGPLALPIPKNVVLLSMMEAAGRQKKIDGQQKKEAEDTDSVESGVDSHEEEAEQFDLGAIISSMATMSGPCGTYAVRERFGLAVLPGDPRRNRSFSGEREADVPEPAREREPFSLTFGQKLQIVDFRDGVAKLARGEGYVVATSSQLVKVGGPLDESCRLEGLLYTVASRGYDLQRALAENKLVVTHLQSQIDAIKLEGPSHPVVGEVPVDELTASRSGDDSDTHPSTPQSVDQSGILQRVLRSPINGNMAVGSPASHDILSDMVEDGDAVYSRSSPGFPSSLDSIDNEEMVRAGMPTIYRRTESAGDLQQFTFGCGSSLLAGAANEFFGESPTPAATQRYSPRTFNNATRPHSQTYHVDQTPSIAPQFTSSFDGINFRTGMSGHRALLSTNPGRENRQRREIRMMSEHRGIGKARGTSRTSPKSLPSFGPRYE